MKLYVIYDYKSIYPELRGRELTDALIRRCLGNENLEIRRTDKGKPYVLTDEETGAGPHISVSHSGSTFALAVSDSEVGLDIQYARSVRAERIASRVFTDSENEEIAADGTGERFFELWTRKEACSKYTGAGLEQVMKKEEVSGNEDVRFIDLRLEDGCFCSICIGTEEGDQSDEVQISYGK